MRKALVIDNMNILSPSYYLVEGRSQTSLGKRLDLAKLVQDQDIHEIVFIKTNLNQNFPFTRGKRIRHFNSHSEYERWLKR